MEFNTAQYSWSDQQVVMLGRVVTGIRGVKAKTTREKEHLHAAGTDALSIQSGKRTITGEIKLLQSEYEALNAAARASGGQDVTDLTVDIALAYIPKAGGPMIRKTFKGCEFTEAEEGMSEGDKFMEITLPFLALSIK